ncbi:MAG: RNA methyltransferase [Firmicutes bacterium HGW-Firmicutes-20]|nr:MAG: RNA methyltransferase [Firmicutes bacterium HGW-Firmicutes-20]PKM67767.1 MAG: RNA methyltransferase [Firmicutes bacterium HGW-Firmicutes-19]
MIFEGALSVKAVIQGKKREVTYVWADKNKKSERDFQYIQRLCESHGIPFFWKLREEIDTVASGKTHGGVIASASERRFDNIDNIKGMDFVLLVEGIEDPFNLGYIFRTAAAAGAQAVITRSRDWSFSESVICKSSAGVSERMLWVLSEDFDQTGAKIKELGFKIFCALRDDSAIEMSSADLNQPLCLCIGGEMRGLSKAIIQHSHQNIYIAYPTDTKVALPAAQATAVLCFEVVRQRKK